MSEDQGKEGVMWRQSWLVVLMWQAVIGWRHASCEPIGLPDFGSCQLAVDRSVVGPPEQVTFNCCMTAVPPEVEIHEFRFEDYGLTGGAGGIHRLRTAAHRASKERMKQYNEAYARMKALPPEDPRSFASQASIHCAFCNGAYLQQSQRLNTTSGFAGKPPPLQVHFSWLFLPWHRWFLFFHELILSSLVDDPSFALVYWNWDDQQFGGNVIPPMFLRDDCPALVDTRRNPAHDYLHGSPNASLSQYIVRLSPADNSSDASAVIQSNLNVMYKSVVTARTAELFSGGVFRLGMDIENSTVLNVGLAGSVEAGPHNGVHFWAGDPGKELHEDMGTFSTAARDPLFYAHHSNIDRMWHIWRHAMPEGSRSDHNDTDFLNATFVFYDHLSRLVRVSARQALQIDALGYSYDLRPSSYLPWIYYKPPASSAASSAAVSAARSLGAAYISANSSVELPLSASPFLAILPNPGASAASSAYALEIRGLRVGFGSNHSGGAAPEFLLQLAVFVNLPTASAATPTHTAEFVGAYTLLPRSRKRPFLTNVRLEIGDNLRLIGIQDQPLVVISIVVKRRLPSHLAASIRGLRLC